MCLCMRVRVCVQSSCVYQFREEERITGMTGREQTALLPVDADRVGEWPQWAASRPQALM